MDTLTQAALGGTIAAAGFQQRLGRKALLVGMLAGVAPDFDVLFRLAGEWQSLRHHRGVSHSLLALPLVAAALGPVLARASRRGRARDWTHLLFWALCTHPLLDLMTAYGTQLLAPLSAQRFALDAISIIDPLYTLPLFCALVVAVRAHGIPGRLDHSRRVAWLALGLSSAYLGLGYIQGRVAERRAYAQLESIGRRPLRLRALPTLANIWVWRVLAAEPPNHFYVGYTGNLLPRPIAFQPFTATTATTAVAARNALNSDHGELFRWFTGGWLRAYAEDDELVLTDLRYGFITDAEASVFQAYAPLAQGVPLHRRSNRPKDVQAEFRAILALLIGQPP